MCLCRCLCLQLLSSELRIESSRVLQAVRFLLARQCLQAERDVIRRRQAEAEAQYRASKEVDELEQTLSDQTALATSVGGASVP
jgi:hypothetical protein